MGGQYCGTIGDGCGHSLPCQTPYDAGQTCGGVQLHVIDPRAMDAVRTGVAMLVTAKQLYPSTFGWTPNGHFDKLTGSDRMRTMVDAGAAGIF